VEHSGFECFGDDFDGPIVDPARWVDHYLPQWTTPERSLARYEFREGGGLRLRIDADQPAWRDDGGGGTAPNAGSSGLRVSNIQTGAYSGAEGAERGTHRSDPSLRVRTPVATRRLWTPTSGRVEVTLSASGDPTCMTAVWLVGFEEDSPDDSGEICVAELFGNVIGAEGSRINVGVKAHRDPRLRTEMAQLTLPLDATEEHTYGAVFTPNRVEFLVDGRVIHHIDQGTTYPLQLMIDLFEFPESEYRAPAAYPKTAVVRRVRGSG
jgi:hypothetical protein